MHGFILIVELISILFILLQFKPDYKSGISEAKKIKEVYVIATFDSQSFMWWIVFLLNIFLI